MRQAIEILLFYTHKDAKMARELLKHLSVLEQQEPRMVSIWSEDMLLPGQQWESAVVKHLRNAQIILILVSADLLASRFTSSLLPLIEERQKAGAHVFPVILRPAFLGEGFLAQLQALPSKGHPISMWASRDLAYLEIIDALKKVIQAPNTPLEIESELKRLQTSLETLSQQDLLALILDLRLNISPLLEEKSQTNENELPQINIEKLLQQVREQDRVAELSDYVRKNLPATH